MELTMKHFWFVSSDGLVHVQNWVSCYQGQHHVHTREDFAKWRRKAAIGSLVHMKAGTCDCGLKAGESREGRAA